MCESYQVVTKEQPLICLFIKGVKRALIVSAMVLDQSIFRGATQTKSKKRKRRTSEDESEAAAKKVKKSKKEKKKKKKIEVGS